MKGDGKERDQSLLFGPDTPNRHAPAEQGQNIECRHTCSDVTAKPQGARFNPDQRIVFAVLHGIYRIIANDPEYRAGIKPEHGSIGLSGNGDPADQCAPAKH